MPDNLILDHVTPNFTVHEKSSIHLALKTPTKPLHSKSISNPAQVAPFAKSIFDIPNHGRTETCKAYKQLLRHFALNAYGFANAIIRM
tara:strand:+ start:217 stop:480 length:264 start_codon:yes stop_codon:yes gene_type:complete